MGATSYLWTITNGTITSGNGTGSIKYTAGASNSVKLAVTVGNSAGCKTTGTRSVTTMSAPNATISATSSVCSGSMGNTASVAIAGGGATYTWIISGGTITSGAGTSSITYTAAASGSVMVSVTIRNSAGCTTACSKTIAISNKLTPAFAAIGKLCKGAGAPALPTTSTNGVKGTWSPSTISTSATGTKTYVFTPAAGQCAVVKSVNITVQQCTSAARVLPTITTPQPVNPLDATVTPNPTTVEFTLKLKGGSNEPVEIRVLDVAGRSLHYARGSAGQSYKFGQRFTSGMYIIEILQGKTVKIMKVVKGK